MKVILIQNAPGLGKADEIKDVADGYARNFLFARNLAVLATKKALEDLKIRKSRMSRESEQDLAKQQSMADRLEGFEISIAQKAGDSGILYAAVGPQKVAEELKKAGFDVKKNQIEMKPVKEAGEYRAKIRLEHGLEAEITIIVSAK